MTHYVVVVENSRAVRNTGNTMQKVASEVTYTTLGQHLLTALYRPSAWGIRPEVLQESFTAPGLEKFLGRIVDDLELQVDSEADALWDEFLSYFPNEDVQDDPLRRSS